MPADSDRMHLAFATSRFYLFKPAVIAANCWSAASKSSTISAVYDRRKVGRSWASCVRCLDATPGKFFGGSGCGTLISSSFLLVECNSPQLRCILPPLEAAITAVRLVRVMGLGCSAPLITIRRKVV